MMQIGMSISMAVISIAGFIIFIMVLIKQFSRGGVLKGLLGLITCGLYTFIWGWVKHRQFALTKIMTAWSILSLVSIVMPAVFGTTMAMNMFDELGLSRGDLKTIINDNKPAGMPVRKPVRQPAAQPAKPAVTQQTAGGSGAKHAPAGVPASAPADPDSIAGAAMALWQDGRYADPARAVDCWSQVLVQRPDSAEAYNNRGLGYSGTNRYPQALSDFDQALSLKPDFAVALNNRGNALYELAQYQRAREDFSRCLELQPEYAKASLNRGLANFRLNRVEEACRDFQKACELGDCDGLKWAMSSEVCN